MPDISHRVAIQSSPENVYRALIGREGLAGWRAVDNRGVCKVGDVIEFHLGPRARIDMRVLELEAAKRVVWQPVDGPLEWIGTTVSFGLIPHDDFTVVLFRHQGWKRSIDSAHHCSTEWALFLISMKSLLETGKRPPCPNGTHASCGGERR